MRGKKGSKGERGRGGEGRGEREMCRESQTHKESQGDTGRVRE